MKKTLLKSIGFILGVNLLTVISVYLPMRIEKIWVFFTIPFLFGFVPTAYFLIKRNTEYSWRYLLFSVISALFVTYPLYCLCSMFCDIDEPLFSVYLPVILGSIFVVDIFVNLVNMKIKRSEKPKHGLYKSFLFALLLTTFFMAALAFFTYFWFNEPNGYTLPVSLAISVPILSFFYVKLKKSSKTPWIYTVFFLIFTFIAYFGMGLYADTKNEWLGGLCAMFAFIIPGVVAAGIIDSAVFGIRMIKANVKTKLIRKSE